MKTLFTILFLGAACLFMASCLGSKSGSTSVPKSTPTTTPNASTSRTDSGAKYDAGLEGYWYLSKMVDAKGGETTQKDLSEKPCNVYFGKDGKFTGFTGRNNLTGNYTTETDGIKINILSGTKAMDKPWGANFAKNIAMVKAFRFAGKELMLREPSGATMVFTRKKKK